MTTTQNSPTKKLYEGKTSERSTTPTAAQSNTPGTRPIAAVLTRLVPLVLFIAIWELGARYLGAIDISGAFSTISALGTLLTDPALWTALAESNQALFIGFFGALFVGLPLGLLMGRNRVVDSVFQGYLSILLVAPVAMVIPLIIMALGFGTISRSIIIFIFVLPMIIVNSRSGVQTVSTDLLDMGRSFGANEPQLWRHVILPSAAPAIFTGLRIGIGRAVTGMVISEWLLAAVGVGALLLEYRGTFQSDLLFGVIIIVLVESLLLIQILRILERRFIGSATQ